MLEKRENICRDKVEFACIENLVPKNHLLRDIENAIDFSFIYDLVKDLYCEDNGRPSIDPVVLIKMQLIQYIFGISSMRQTAKEIEVNLAYKWFLGYGLNESTPHFSVISKNYYRRFKDTNVFEIIFEKILEEAIRCGFVKTETVFIDGTHIKANANKRKTVTEYVKKEAKFYDEKLREEIEQDRLEHGKQPLKAKEEELKKITKSTTDPESGMFHKGEHERCLAYNANTACDKNGFVLGTVVTPGNENDSSSFDKIYNDVTNRFDNINNVVLDSGYRTPPICKMVIDDNRDIFLPYKRPMTKDGYFKKYEYKYNEKDNCYICPNNKILHYSNTNKDGYREYRSRKKDCKDCIYKGKCTASEVKVFQRHLWQGYIEKAEEIRQSEKFKEIYPKRKETIERVFADAKEKHSMRYTRLKGLERVTREIQLKFACMNLKKLAKWKKKNGYFPPERENIYQFMENIIQYFKKYMRKPRFT